MMLRTEYLSDEELECLIAETEAEHMISAPPDLAENIICEIQILKRETKKQEKLYIKKQRQKEFHTFCFRVVVAMAASLFVLFAPVDSIKDGIEEIMPVQDWEKQQDSFTRGDFIQRKNRLGDLLQQRIILQNSDEVNIFGNRDGGR